MASRTAPEAVSMPAEFPVRLYLRALRQYQKLLDLRRLSSKDKVSIVVTIPRFHSFCLVIVLSRCLQKVFT